MDKKLEDMGRDLIAKKGMEIHIVQCKYWSKKKLIHEKHIYQLFGSAVHYKLSKTRNFKIVPVFVTNIQLSNKAKDVAEFLKVRYREKKELGDFPRIKCNINTDNYNGLSKIYHLPMDQQYDKTKICKKGEFLASTVNEAMQAGFRRAFRWHGNNS